MNPYVIRFTIANVVLSIVLAILMEVLKLNAGSGMAAGCAIASSIFSAMAFAKDHKREPTLEEKKTFAWRALLATWAVSLVFFALYLAIFSTGAEARGFLGALRSGSMLAIVLGTMLLISAIYYLGIRWAFGWYAKLALKKAR